MPKLWNDTIEAHRAAVREATLAATAALVAEHGPLSVTMSQIAQKTGIGRATLYKYFPDVESILLAWHERQVAEHVEHLAVLADRAGEPGKALEGVLEAYALIRYTHHGGEIAALLHHGEHVAVAQLRLTGLITALLTDAAQAAVVRDDVAPDELARYCLHALNAAGELASKAAVRRLVEVTLAGLRSGGARPPRATKRAR